MFDIDDTLYLEREYVHSGFGAVGSYLRRTLGVSGFEALAWRMFVVGRRHSIINEALDELGVQAAPGLVDCLVNVYRTHSPSIRLLEDAVEGLQSCGRFAQLAVVTDGPAASQKAKIRALGLEASCASIIVTAELGDKFVKPSPLAFKRLQSDFGTVPSSCVYIADNPAKDFVGPKRLGWSTLRVRRPGSLHESIDSNDDVDFEAGSIVELLRYKFSSEI